MNPRITTRRHGRLAVAIASLGLLFGMPAMSLAQSSKGNNGKQNAAANANANGVNHANANGVGNAPVPEPATWVAMATLVGIAGAVFAAKKRRRTA